MKRVVLSIVAVIAGPVWGQEGTSIVDTPHNLSATGPGPIRALAEDRICIFCHTPHGSRAVAPLWNRFDSTATYLPYDSPTLDAAPGQPTGASKLCLSCHDGTIALGQLISEPAPIGMAGGVVTLPPGHGLIGTDLRDDHPTSFTPVLENPELAPPSEWGEALQLDVRGEFQCTSCHDAHDNSFGEFLVMDNTEGAMCLVCHRLEGWVGSSHAEARPPLVSPLHVGRIPGGCAVCHTPHGAGGPPLIRSAEEEQVCLSCHGGTDPAGANIAAAMRRPFGHFADRQRGVHRAGESPAQAAGHAECADCHNAHQSTDRPPAGLADLGGALDGVPGVTLTGVRVNEAQQEYEVCLRCHGGVDTSPHGFPVRRVLEQFDLAREIDPSNPSYHPIAATGKNPHVPSLLAPLAEGSTIRCSDCHRGERGGVAGPHGSIHEWLLSGEYQTGDGVMESPRAYEQCYQCHSRTSILADESFPTHRLHVVDDRTSCAVCHDPHGVSLTQGDPMEHTHLINFDDAVVDPDPVTGRLAFVDLGERAGTCFLTCHGKPHSPLSY
jgi:predicted CXXCH cytochrome family protein